MITLRPQWSTVRVQEPQDVGAGHGVEVSGGFVREDDLGSRHEGASHGHPLLLAAGQFGRTMVEAMADSHRLDHLIESARVDRGALEGQRQRMFLRDVERRRSRLKDWNTKPTR